MAITLEDELAVLTSLLDEPALQEITVDDGFFTECTEHDGCRVV